MASPMLKSRQSGISLVELMLGVTVALIILVGVLAVTLRISTSGASSVQSTRLNQQMRSTMDFVTKELQRSGYVNWVEAWGTSGTGTGGMLLFQDRDGNDAIDSRDFYAGVVPTIDQIGDVSLQKLVSSAGTAVTGSCPPLDDCDCVLYSYDLDEDGAKSAAGGRFEDFGFRRTEDANGRGMIQMRVSGSHDCTSGGWVEITDDNVNVTGFSLNMIYATTNTGIGDDSTVYRLDSSNGWQWSAGDFRSGIGTGADECMPSLGTDTAAMDAGDVMCLERRSISVKIEGESAEDPDVRAQLDGRVKLKNDYWNWSP